MEIFHFLSSVASQISLAMSVRVQGGGCVLKLENIIWGTVKAGLLTGSMKSHGHTILLLVSSELLCVQTKKIPLSQEIQRCLRYGPYP